MRLIYVSGDGDYSAMLFDDCASISVEEAYQRAVDNGGNYTYEIEDEDKTVNIRAFEFGEVDPKFIDFITSNIVDYDHSKARDFFIVKEDE